MSLMTTTHLNFRGQAREALELYKSVFGGQLMAFTYADAHDDAFGAKPEEIKWGQVEAPTGFRVMAYDVPADKAFSRGEDPIFVSIRGTDADEITACFKGLAEGGTVQADLGPAGFSPLYGMVTDRFGVAWVLDVQAG